MFTVQVQPIRYRNAVDLVAAWLGVRGREAVYASHRRITFTIGRRKIRCKTGRDHVRFIRQNGLWGFCRKLAKRSWEIHFWVCSKTPIIDVMDLMAHELAHTFGYGEDMAAKFGGIAGFGWHLWKQEKRYKQKASRKPLRLWTHRRQWKLSPVTGLSRAATAVSGARFSRTCCVRIAGLSLTSAGRRSWPESVSSRHNAKENEDA
jgi:hypothetical protein